MPEPRSFLTALGAISKPATVLIEKVSEALGGAFKPMQIKRIAQAEADANLIRAQNQIDISDIQMRGMLRSIREEGLRQANIESVLVKAIPLLSADAKPEAMGKDWITHAFDRLRLVSDEKMQSLWARIIAGEANVPGSFSKKTLDLVASMEKSDAEQFTKLCGCLWDIEGPVLMAFDVQKGMLQHCGITFDITSHLEYMGLVQIVLVGHYSHDKNLTNLFVTYNGRSMRIICPSDMTNLSLGPVTLTKAGEQLAKMSGSSFVEACYLHAVQHWYDTGCTLISLLRPSPDAAVVQVQ